MNTGNQAKYGPISQPAERSRRRARAAANTTGQREDLNALAEWVHRWPEYIPGPWAARQIGVTRAAVNMGVRRGLVRATDFRLADGTVVRLVSAADVARIGARRSLPADLRARLAPLARRPRVRKPKPARRGTGVRQSKPRGRSSRR